MSEQPASWWDEIEIRQNWVNKLFYGDNLEILRDRIPAESIDLIYLDPPFNSNRSYGGEHRTATHMAKTHAERLLTRNHMGWAPPDLYVGHGKWERVACDINGA